MGKRVMRSNKRTQRRRGSKLKQRKKRSKLLKRTTKRRNSFKKKNTYKRRRTNMKRGGRPVKEALEKFVKDYNDGIYTDGPYRRFENKLARDLTKLIDEGIRIRLVRRTLMRDRDDERICFIQRVDQGELFLYFNKYIHTNSCPKYKYSLGRKHGISLTHLLDNYSAYVRGNDNDGYLDFMRKPKKKFGYTFFKDDL